MPEGLGHVADRFGLRVTRREGQIRVSRGGQVFEVALPGWFSAHERRDVWATMLGIRLATDRLESTYDFALERPGQSDRQNHLSLYGARESRLVPLLTVSTVEALCGEKIACVPWAGDVVEVFMTGWKREWHVFAESDFSRVDFDRTSLQEFARYTLFHDEGSQKPRPVVTRVPGGRVKMFRHGDGKMAARAVLMPDYDWDATMQRGVFAIPSFDVMVVGQPDEPGDERMAYEVAAQAREIWRTDAYPLMSTVFQMDHSTFDAGLDVLPTDRPRRESPVLVNRIVS
jgi:hypothetical protein